MKIGFSRILLFCCGFAALSFSAFYFLPFAGKSVVPAFPKDSFLVICYHDIEEPGPAQKPESVSQEHLTEQFSWLRDQGYHVISLDDLLAAQAGQKPLPPRPVILTFDDGYISFYQTVYPLLKRFHYPAVTGLVDEWMETPVEAAGKPPGSVRYNDVWLPRSAFLTWDQVREMKKSGLVEVASHSHRLHRGKLANPQGNSEPAPVTFTYDPATRTYQSLENYKDVLNADAKASAQTILKETGEAPRAMIWPYGLYNQIDLDAEKRHGMPITFTLDREGLGNLNNLAAIPRYFVQDDPDIQKFASGISRKIEGRPLRTVEVDLDRVYDADPAQLGRNLDALIERVYRMRISAVYLKGFSDTAKPGVASSVYFPSRVLPMKADLFNRVAWQLKTRANVMVFGWLPISAFDFGHEPATHQRIIDLYEDMAMYGPISGLKFEGVMTNANGKPLAAAEIDTRIRFTRELVSHAGQFRMPLKAINILPASLMDARQDLYAQSLSSFDVTVVKTPPGFDNRRLTELVTKAAAAAPDALRRTSFELPPDANVNDLQQDMQFLSLYAAPNFGLSSYDFMNNKPEEEGLFADFSLQDGEHY